MTEEPLIAVNLDPASETMNYKQTEKGITVIFAPAMSDADRRGLSKRNYRRLVLNKAKKIGIEIPYETFMGKSITDQFLFLRQYIPDGHQPLEINPWYVEDKAVTTPIGKFQWPAPAEGVVYKMDEAGNKLPINLELGVPYEEAMVTEIAKANDMSYEDLTKQIPQVYDPVNNVMTTDIDDPRFNRGLSRVLAPSVGFHDETCKVCGGSGERASGACQNCRGVGTVRVENVKP